MSKRPTFSIVLAILLIVAGSFIGYLWAKVQHLEGQLANSQDPVLRAVYGERTIIGSATEGTNPLSAD